jgi:hypothetical protein
MHQEVLEVPNTVHMVASNRACAVLQNPSHCVVPPNCHRSAQQALQLLLLHVLSLQQGVSYTTCLVSLLMYVNSSCSATAAGMVTDLTNQPHRQRHARAGQRPTYQAIKQLLQTLHRQGYVLCTVFTEHRAFSFTVAT